MLNLMVLLLSALLLAIVSSARSDVEPLLSSPVITKTITYDQAPEPAQPQLFALPHLRSAEPTHVEVHEPAFAKLGDVVESIPTAVSHQSSTIVHSRAQRVTPIVAPAVRTYAAPLHHPIELRAWSPAGLSAPATAAAYVPAHLPMQLLWRTYPYATYAASYAPGYGGPFVHTA